MLFSPPFSWKSKWEAPVYYPSGVTGFNITSAFFLAVSTVYTSSSYEYQVFHLFCCKHLKCSMLVVRCAIFSSHAYFTFPRFELQLQTRGFTHHNTGSTLRGQSVRKTGRRTLCHLLRLPESIHAEASPIYRNTLRLSRVIFSSVRMEIKVWEMFDISQARHTFTKHGWRLVGFNTDRCTSPKINKPPR